MTNAGNRHSGGRRQVEELTTAECWSLLEGSNLGRLAVVHADGTPDIFPINYLTHEGAVFIRTAYDSKLLHIRHNPVVAFEVDGQTDDVWWSVVIKGTAARAPMDAETRESGIDRLVTASPTRKEFVMKLTVSAITGRRFAKADAVTAASGEEPSAAEPTTPPAQPPEPAPATGTHQVRGRAARPHDIPHHSPSSGARSTDSGD